MWTELLLLRGLPAKKTGMTRVVAFGVRGGEDPEVTNDSKAQRLNSIGRQVSPTHDAGKCLAAHQGDGAEQWVMEKCILLLRQSQHCLEEASDKHLIHHEQGYPEGMDASRLNQIIGKQTGGNLKWGLEISAEFLPKLQERLSGIVQEMGQDGLSSVRGGKFIRPTSCWLHCGPCNICVGENQMCSSDIFWRCCR